MSSLGSKPFINSLVLIQRQMNLFVKCKHKEGKNQKARIASKAPDSNSLTFSCLDFYSSRVQLRARNTKLGKEANKNYDCLMDETQLFSYCAMVYL